MLFGKRKKREIRRVILMRHGDASFKANSDSERELTQIGVNEIAGVTVKLEQNGISPQLILCSTAKRAAQSAVLVQKALEICPDIVHNSQLYMSSHRQIVQLIGELDIKYHSVLIVGHNPEISGATDHLTGSRQMLGTGNAAVIEYSCRDWQDWGAIDGYDTIAKLVVTCYPD